MSAIPASRTLANNLTNLELPSMVDNRVTCAKFLLSFSTFALFFGSLLLADASHNAAKADLRMCNNTKSKVSVAVGYRGEVDWTTEGWWNFEAGKCQVIFKGPIRSRYFYFYAMDVDDGGEWGGQAMMCTQPKTFTVVSTKDCVARGFEKTGFFEIDTGDQETWTVKLNEPTEESNGAQ